MLYFPAKMFVRCTTRKKNGKSHRYWSLVENKRCAGDKVVQRHVLYLGEINQRQEVVWQDAAEAFPDDKPPARTAALFPGERALEAEAATQVVRIRLSEMALRKPRQYGACWLACHLYQELGLDRFWAQRLPPGRKGTRWDLILRTLVAYRLIAPGSEWRLHREWFERSGMGDLLGCDFAALAEAHKLYRCHDRLKELTRMAPKRDALLLKLGAASHQAPAAWRLFEIRVPEAPRRRKRKKKRPAPAPPAQWSWRLRWDKLRDVRRHEGRYLLRSNTPAPPAAQLRQFYLQLGHVEEAFRNPKGDLGLRPIFHQDMPRIEAHIFISFLAYCLHVTPAGCATSPPG